MTARSPDAASRLLELNPERVGASTGYMAELRGDWPSLLAEATAVSSRVLELSALSAAEWPGLTDFLRTGSLEGFDYVSVHGPAKGWTGTAEQLAAALGDLPASVAAVVMHPETLAEPAAFADLGNRLLLENMDPRKEDARTVAELEPYFADVPAAAFCFDVPHAWLGDPSLALAHELLDAFGDRLAEVHLSSILADGTHVPLRAGDAARFRPVLERCLGVPWVLEAAPPVR